MTKRYLDLNDLGATLGKARQKRALADGHDDPGDEPLTYDTVWTYVQRWTNPKYFRGSYATFAANPPRPPNGPPSTAIWIPLLGESIADIEDAWTTWYMRQPGRGRPRAGQMDGLEPPAWTKLPNDKRYLDLSDLGTLFGKARQNRALLEGRKDPGDKPLTDDTVKLYVWRYARTASGYRQRHLRTKSDPNAKIYANNPMPAPNGPPRPAPLIWIPEPGQPLEPLIQQHLTWYNNRPGAGRGANKKGESDV